MGSFVSLGAYTWLSSLLLTVVNAALVGVVGWLLIKFLLGFIAKFLKKTKIDPLLHTVILSVTKIALLVLLAISVLDKLGIPTTSIITSLGAVGLAISLAVKDSIATLAGGVVILVLKPFNLGDYVEIDGLGGTVREITMFNTVLNTPDNKRISLPNDSVYKAKVVNYSAEPNRRLDLVFTIGYNDDYDKAKALIEKVIRDCPLALDDPAGFEESTGSLRYLDGTLPAADSDEDWWNMVYKWDDCPVLAGLDLGDYGPDTTQSRSGSSQEYMSQFYVGMRGAWNSGTADNLAGGEEFWQKLTEGAVSTAAPEG